MSVKEKVSIDEIIKFLNDALEYDAEAIEKLCFDRIKCNGEMMDHPTIQVHCRNSKCSVGLIGILNGIFGIDKFGWGHISVIIDDETGKIQKFKKLTEEKVKEWVENDD